MLGPDVCVCVGGGGLTATTVKYHDPFDPLDPSATEQLGNSRNSVVHTEINIKEDDKWKNCFYHPYRLDNGSSLL